MGSEIKGTDSSNAVLGAVVGSSGGKYFGEKTKNVLPSKAAEVLGNITGNLATEAATDAGELMLRADDK